MSENQFLELCFTVLNLIYFILDLIVMHWYFALLFAAGLVGLGFEVIGELNDYNDTINN